MEKSMFSRISSSTYRSLSNSSHELPRWRSPSPTASTIPPPIVQSTYGPSPSQTIAQSVIVEKPSPLEDRQSELEADLQYLLDAQAEGLVRGLEGGLQDDQSSTGSTTPTAQSVRSASARRAARPPRRKLGLRSARRGIYNSILALSAVKQEELRAIDEDVHEKDRTLKQIDEWEEKRKGLQEASASVDSNEDTIRVQRLHEQADAVQEEINAVELQLSDMKIRHRKLMRQATAVENAVQAKMASYTSSLRMLDEEVKQFLSVDPTGQSPRPTSRDGKKSVWQLPPKRRTLDMAKEHWRETRKSVSQQREGVEYEKTALDEGAAVWKDVVAQVTEFEKKLRVEMASLSSLSTMQHTSVKDSGLQDDSQRLQKLMQHMDSVVEMLESKFGLAQERNWNLLIAGIGAELDALKQGRALLEGVLGRAGASNGSAEEESDPLSAPPGDLEGAEIHELDKSFETARRRRASNSTDSEDDPDPELLFSQQDPDTE